jgi:MFS family permease
MIRARTVFCLGLAQLVNWGITYYLIGAFGELIVAERGWSREVVYGGYAVALLVMGLTSSRVGRLIDRHGGRRVMNVGAAINAAGCFAIAASDDIAFYLAAWAVMGIGMRLTLYDAAFATLARLGGPAAKRPIAQITLLGGLASTVFWPLGHGLAEQFGYQGALVCYGGFALATILLHQMIPDGRHQDIPRPADEAPLPPPRAAAGRALLFAGALYALTAAGTNFLNAGISAHMIGMLAAMGLAFGTAVWVSSLRGIGQSTARLVEVLFGRRVEPLNLNVLAAFLMASAFALGAVGGGEVPTAIAFALMFGAGNGLMTITRGTIPLVLFDHRTYGAFVGRLLAPSFFLSAAAPLIYAVTVESFGGRGGMVLSLAISCVIFVAAVALRLRFGAKGDAASVHQ